MSEDINKEAAEVKEFNLSAIRIRCIEDGVIICVETRDGRDYDEKEYFVKSMNKVPAFLRKFIKDSIVYS